jgi:hypothetical protein
MEEFPLISTIVMVYRLSSASFSDPGRSKIALPSFKLHAFEGTLEIFSTAGNLSYFLV